MGIRNTVVVALLPVALFAAGCGKMKKAAERTSDTKVLKQIGLLYQNYIDTSNKPPADMNDLLRVDGRNSQAIGLAEAVKSGKYVIVWNAAIQRDRTKASHAVLGYQSEVPSAGGMVLMGDGNVKYMTASEFQSTPKAGGK